MLWMSICGHIYGVVCNVSNVCMYIWQVTISAVENAASVSSLVLTTEVVVSDLPQKTSPESSEDYQ